MACCTCRRAPALRFRSLRYAHWRETCWYLCSGPPHSHKLVTTAAHSPHCGECAAAMAIGWLSRAPEKRYQQVRDARHHAAPSKRIRLRVESGRASLPEAFGCIARQGPMLRIDSHRRTVNLTTRPTRCAWMRLDAPTGPGGARAVRFVALCGQGEALTSYPTASGSWRCNTSSLGCRRARSEQSRPTCT